VGAEFEGGSWMQSFNIELIQRAGLAKAWANALQVLAPYPQA